MIRIAGSLSSFTSKEVADFFSRAKALSRNSFFTLLCTPTKKAFGRILIITPRRIGTAPERNLLKRRIRALFYEKKLFEKGCDYAIIFKREAAALPFQKLQQIVLSAISKPM